MNAGDIALLFIRAAEVERASPEHVGPAPLRGQQLPYVHDFADKLNWRKEPGDKLEKGADPLSDERKLFWERLGLMPTAREMAELEGLYDLILIVERDEERRALLAWARSKVGGKAFRRWCFQVEGIHPETGRRRKDRALARMSAGLVRSDMQHSAEGRSPLLHSGQENGQFLDTIEEDAGKRDGLNNWAADDAFSPFLADVVHDFAWAQKRNERRRRREAAKRKRAA